MNKLPYKTFIESFQYVPRVAISLFITNENKEVLLLKRAKPPFVDYWHLPGSFLIKGERIKDCIERIIKEELGFDQNYLNPSFVFISEDLDKDPRGHVIDLIYKLTIESKVFTPVNDTKEIQFFKKLPENIGFNHREVLKCLIKTLDK